jgi:GSH-dependent disulfide-bond oxidoreductase
MASYPWIVPHKRQEQKIEEFPYLHKWFERIRQRPATIKAYDVAKTVNVAPSVTEESKKILFGQDSKVVK